MIKRLLKTAAFFGIVVLTMNTVDGLVIDKVEMNKAKASTFVVDAVTLSGGGIGTAVAINDTGLLITNSHVVPLDTLAITVKGANGKLHDAIIVKRDVKEDLALIQIMDNSATSPITFGKDAVYGDKVFAVGSSLGIPFQVSMGVASDVLTSRIGKRTPSDARIEHGNSGGGLFNSKGELVAINTNMVSNHDPVIVVDGNKVSESKSLYETNGQGISLSIPASVVQEFIKGL